MRIPHFNIILEAGGGSPPACHMTSFEGEYFKKANDRRGSFF